MVCVWGEVRACVRVCVCLRLSVVCKFDNPKTLLPGIINLKYDGI